MIDTLRLTAEEATGLLERKEVSPEELSGAYAEAVEARNAELNAFLHVENEVGRSVPIALKDCIGTKGVPTTAGSKILEGYVPVFDSTVAARCKDAGLPLIGKTNMDEFAMGSSTENSAYGPAHNPWDPERVPGRLVGRLRGGGRRRARSLGARLRHRRLDQAAGRALRPRRPAPDLRHGLALRHRRLRVEPRPGRADHEDRPRQRAGSTRSSPAAIRCDSTTVDSPAVVELPTAEDLKGLRIGVPRELNEAEGIEPGVAEAVKRTIALAEELGAEVGETSLPRSVDYGLACYYLIAPAEASSNLARYDGVRYGYRADGVADLLDMYLRTRWEGFGPEPQRRIMLGTYALSAGYYDAYYGQAQKVRTLIGQEFAAAFEQLRRPRQPDLADRRLQDRREVREPARPLRLRRPDDPAEHGRPARPVDPVRAVRGSAGRVCSSWARSSRRTSSSEPATPSSARSASTTSRSGSDDLSGSRSSAWRSTSS